MIVSPWAHRRRFLDYWLPRFAFRSLRRARRALKESFGPWDYVTLAAFCGALILAAVWVRQ